MKRDMELIRKLLLYVEEHGKYTGLRDNDIVIDGYTPEQIGYNLWLLHDGRYIGIIDLRCDHDTYYRCIVTNITWDGHELLDTIRDDGVWKKTKERLAPVGSVGIEVLKAVAVSVAKGMLGLGGG